MPFVEDPNAESATNDGDVAFPRIGSDLLDPLGSDEEPLDSGPIDFEALQGSADKVGTETDENKDGDESEEPENGAENEQESDKDDDDEDEDIPDAKPQPAPAPAKKRGRPSLGGAKTPQSKKPKAAGTAGRKRKAESSADEPATKRPGRGRATAAAASEAIKQTSSKRGRAALETAKATPKTTGAKRGPKPKAKKQEEYEVERIVEHVGAGKTVKYLVKWKGYEDKESTWEPKSNLEHAADLLREYEAAAKKEKKAALAEKKAAGPAEKLPGPRKGVAKKTATAVKPAGRAGRTGRPGRPRKN